MLRFAAAACSRCSQCLSAEQRAPPAHGRRTRARARSGWPRARVSSCGEVGRVPAAVHVGFGEGDVAAREHLAAPVAPVAAPRSSAARHARGRRGRNDAYRRSGVVSASSPCVSRLEQREQQAPGWRHGGAAGTAGRHAGRAAQVIGANWIVSSMVINEWSPPRWRRACRKNGTRFTASFSACQ